MKIGIDATPLPAQPFGAGKYIIELIRHLPLQTSAHRFVVFATPSGRRQIGDLPTKNLEWVAAPDLPSSLRLVWEQIRLPALARRHGLDLLHSLHYTSPYTLPCPSVVTFHDMTFFLFPKLHTRTKRFLFPRLIRLSARRASALIANSGSTRRDAMRILGMPPNRIQVTPLGVSKVFQPIRDPQILANSRRRFGLPDAFILFVGLIEPRKNLPLLLKAYAQLVERGDSFLPSLVLAGKKGWGCRQVERLVETLHLQDKVHFAGYFPDDELPIVYNLAQALVYPSTYEGFGFPPLEAMACGTPVIATDVAALAENIGQAGLLIPPLDEHALMEALQTLLSDPGLQMRLTQAGIKRAADFSWERTARLTLQIYESLG